MSRITGIEKDVALGKTVVFLALGRNMALLVVYSWFPVEAGIIPVLFPTSDEL